MKLSNERTAGGGCEGIEEEKSKNTAMEGLIENMDKAFQLFVNLHRQAIVEGAYQRYGSKTVT